MRLTFLRFSVEDFLPVIVVVEPLLDRAQVHGSLDDGEVVGQPQLDCVDRQVEGPSVLVLPHPLDQSVLQELSLVRDPARAMRRRNERRLDDSVDRFLVRLIPGENGILFYNDISINALRVSTITDKIGQDMYSKRTISNYGLI